MHSVTINKAQVPICFNGLLNLYCHIQRLVHTCVHQTLEAQQLSYWTGNPASCTHYSEIRVQFTPWQQWNKNSLILKES